MIVLGDDDYFKNKEYYNRNGWIYHDLLVSGFRTGRSNFYTVYSKRVIQYTGFEKKESNLDILTDLDRMKGTKIGDILSYLRNVICSDECKSVKLETPKISNFF